MNQREPIEIDPIFLSGAKDDKSDFMDKLREARARGGRPEFDKVLKEELAKAAKNAPKDTRPRRYADEDFKIMSPRSDLTKWDQFKYDKTYAFYRAQRRFIRKLNARANKKLPIAERKRCPEALSSRLQARYIKLAEKMFNLRTAYMGWTEIGSGYEKGGKKYDTMGTLPWETKAKDKN